MDTVEERIRQRRTKLIAWYLRRSGNSKKTFGGQWNGRWDAYAYMMIIARSSFAIAIKTARRLGTAMERSYVCKIVPYF